ncbi:MAG TPA: GAF domain-containing protein [Candidatus Limnocylindrales bacterium]|nr:GAF domain-containing protein [Candidatus Limnocylindrales bacterium]
MAEPDLARLIVRHRHVAPMLSALLSGTNAAIRISDEAGTVILERGGGIGSERFPITVDGRTVGWVEGDRLGRAVASVLSYAVAREADKRSLAREALDRYRELNLVYDLAERLSGDLDLATVAGIAVGEAGRLPAGGTGFLYLGDADGTLRAVAGDGPLGRPGEAADGGILAAVASSAIAEEVNDVASDPRTGAAERALASLICAPVVARGRTIGVLGAGSSTPITYQAADLKLLAAIAAIAGPALDQARAHADASSGAGRAPA